MAKNRGEGQLDARLIAVYNKYGLKTFLEVCSEMLTVKASNAGNKKKIVNGEVCEVVLRVMTNHYLKTRGVVGKAFQSVILRDRWDAKNPFRTELDFTLITPGVCLTGECKSFVGDIVVSDGCTLTRDTLVADVERQSKVHARAIKPYLEEFTLKDAGIATPPLGLFCFVYCKGTIADQRTKRAKQLIPIITVRNLFAYYDKVLGSYREKVYNYDRACKTFTTFANSEKLHKEHKDYLGY